MIDVTDYNFQTEDLSHHYQYILPILESVIKDKKPHKIFELGCGNGSLANHISQYADIQGIDPSESAVKIASEKFPQLKIDHGSAYDNLVEKYGQFPFITSFEVVEHVYSPAAYMETINNLLEPGGTLVISTPYHGYWKDLMLALTGKLDAHHTALWEGGHIKFWSIKTLTELVSRVGLEVVSVHRVGRKLPQLAKSMVMVIHKPT